MRAVVTVICCSALVWACPKRELEPADLVRKVRGLDPELFGTVLRQYVHIHELDEEDRERLFSLPDETIVHPGHGPDTTIGRERRINPFVGDSAAL